MNRLTFFIICLLFSEIAYCQKQEKFEINGTINGYEGGQLQLIYYNTDSVFKLVKDTVVAKEGKFHFEGITPYPYYAYIYVIDSFRRTLPFFVDKGKQSLAIDIRSPYEYPNLLSQSNKEYREVYLPLFDSIENDYSMEFKKYRAKGNEQRGKFSQVQSDSFLRIKKMYLQNKAEVLNDYILKYRSSFVAAWNFYMQLQNDNDQVNSDSIFSCFSEPVKKSALGIAIKNRIQKIAKTKQGASFPPFPVLDSSLRKKELKNELKYKYTLVDFWFFKCSPCIKQFEEFKNTFEKFHQKGFDIIGISIDDLKDKEDWIKTIQKHTLPWTQFLDPKGIEADKLEISFFPTNFLLDNKGKILFKNILITDLNEFLEKQLATN